MRGGTRVVKAGVQSGVALARTELPSSINWVYTFSFKIGIFIMLKSFLMLIGQFSNLTFLGMLMIGAQFFMGFIWTANGPIMQDTGLYENPDRLHKALRQYLGAAVVGGVVIVVRCFVSFPYYKNPASVNWFADFFTGIFKGVKDFGTSILFSDNTLWGLFAIIIFVIGARYLNFKFDRDAFNFKKYVKERVANR